MHIEGIVKHVLNFLSIVKTIRRFFLKKYQNIWRNGILSIILHNDKRRNKYGYV